MTTDPTWGRRDMLENSYHVDKTDFTGKNVHLLVYRFYLLWPVVLILGILQTCALVVLCCNHSQLAGQVAQQEVVIRRLEASLEVLSRDGNTGPKDDSEKKSGQVDPGLVYEKTGPSFTVGDADGSQAGYEVWNSRKLLSRLGRSRRNGRHCRCDVTMTQVNDRIATTLDTVLQAHRSATQPWRPGVHLRGVRSSGAVPVIQGPGTLFQWENSNDSSSGGFQLSPNRATLTIGEAGLYLVYSQIAVNGREYRGGTTILEPSCGYETIRIRNEVEKVLLTSVRTQDERGQYYMNIDSETGLFPLDTMSHFGLFDLDAGDKLAVRPTQYSQTDRYLIDSRYNNFGVVMINKV